MSLHNIKRANTHKVMHEFSGRQHFFKVTSGGSGNEHSVSLQLGCDCEYMSVQGVKHGRICSHILAVLGDVLEKGNVDISVGAEQMVQLRRNACLSLVRSGNRKLNDVRTSDSESLKHRQKKEEICAGLEAAGKQFITEAIFKTGGRADILILDDFKVIEIVHSENAQSILDKQKSYPAGIKMEVVNC